MQRQSGSPGYYSAKIPISWTQTLYEILENLWGFVWLNDELAPLSAAQATARCIFDSFFLKSISPDRRWCMQAASRHRCWVMTRGNGLEEQREGGGESLFAHDRQKPAGTSAALQWKPSRHPFSALHVSWWCDYSCATWLWGHCHDAQNICAACVVSVVLLARRPSRAARRRVTRSCKSLKKEKKRKAQCALHKLFCRSASETRSPNYHFHCGPTPATRTSGCEWL